MRALSWLRPTGRMRELKLLLWCLLIGLVLMPLLIFAAGRSSLGSYQNGGLFALWRDYLAGVFTLRPSFLLVAGGAYLALWLLRLLRWGWRKLA